MNLVRKQARLACAEDVWRVIVEENDSPRINPDAPRYLEKCVRRRLARAEVARAEDLRKRLQQAGVAFLPERAVRNVRVGERVERARCGERSEPWLDASDRPDEKLTPT